MRSKGVAGEHSRSMVCNELIAQNAMARGTRYEAIMSFLILTDPAGMRWLTAHEAEYWGFTRKPGQDARTPCPGPVQAVVRPS